MKSGKCPKCGSENIYRSKQRFSFHPQRFIGHWIFIKMGMLGGVKGASLTYFVCDDCRYTESYILDEESMTNIRDAWIPNPNRPKRKNDE